ncbi:MAG: nucleotidyltransferase domain-containing protein [Oscillospiraceae bacterium]|nr:nucleotidyltransferase domain-containing protein [Oscillospiraceae bacterium]
MNTNITNNSEINEIVATILRAVPALEIYLFGSYANGTAKESSDYDFYVIIPDGHQAIESTWKITGTIPKDIRKARSIDMLVGTESKFNRYKNSIGFIENEVIKTGVKLYG